MPKDTEISATRQPKPRPRDASLEKYRREGGPFRPWKPRMPQETHEATTQVTVETIKPGTRKRMPAKERLIREALKAYDYPELDVDFDSLTLVEIVHAARHRLCGDTLADFLVLELDDCIASNATQKKAREEALRAIQNAYGQLDGLLAALR